VVFDDVTVHHNIPHLAGDDTSIVATGEALTTWTARGDMLDDLVGDDRVRGSRCVTRLTTTPPSGGHALRVTPSWSIPARREGRGVRSLLQTQHLVAQDRHFRRELGKPGQLLAQFPVLGAEVIDNSREASNVFVLAGDPTQQHTLTDERCLELDLERCHDASVPAARTSSLPGVLSSHADPAPEECSHWSVGHYL